MAPSQGNCFRLVLVRVSVTRAGKQLLICTSYARTFVLPTQESRDPFTPFFLSPLIFENPPTGFSPLFHRSRGVPSEFGSAFPLARRIGFCAQLTYFSEAFVRTAKNGDSGRREAKGGRKKVGEKVAGGSKRATRALSTTDADHSWSNYLFFQ